MFCPKCGSLLVPKKEDGKKVLACSCGHKNRNLEGTKIKEVVEEKKGIEVIDKDETETLPTTKVTCPKCDHDIAYYWLVQTRAGDEPETKFMKCVECKHTWRDYS
jgi:transcription factor S